MIKIIQSPLFAKQKIKLYKGQIKTLDSVVKKILEDPEISEEKKGTLKGVKAYKFHHEKQLFLLAYEQEADFLNLIMIGSHENYYRDLAKYKNESK